MNKNKLYSVFFWNPPKRIKKKLWRKILEFGLANGFDSFKLVYWGKETLNKKIWEYKTKEYVFEDPHVFGMGGIRPMCIEGFFNMISFGAFLDTYNAGLGFRSLQIYSKNSKLVLNMHSYGGIDVGGLNQSQFRLLKKIILVTGWGVVFKSEGNSTNYDALDPWKKFDAEIENSYPEKNKLIMGFLLKLALQACLEKVRADYEGGKKLKIKLKNHSLNKISEILSEQGLTNCLVYGKPKETSISFKPPSTFSITRLSEPSLFDVSSFAHKNLLRISTIGSKLKRGFSVHPDVKNIDCEFYHISNEKFLERWPHIINYAISHDLNRFKIKYYDDEVIRKKLLFDYKIEDNPIQRYLLGNLNSNSAEKLREIVSSSFGIIQIFLLNPKEDKYIKLDDNHSVEVKNFEEKEFNEFESLIGIWQPIKKQVWVKLVEFAINSGFDNYRLFVQNTTNLPKEWLPELASGGQNFVEKEGWPFKRPMTEQEIRDMLKERDNLVKRLENDKCTWVFERENGKYIGGKITKQTLELIKSIKRNKKNWYKWFSQLLIYDMQKTKFILLDHMEQIYLETPNEKERKKLIEIVTTKLLIRYTNG